MNVYREGNFIYSLVPQNQVISSKLMDATTCKSRATTNSVYIFLRDQCTSNIKKLSRQY